MDIFLRKLNKLTSVENMLNKIISFDSDLQ